MVNAKVNLSPEELQRLGDLELQALLEYIPKWLLVEKNIEDNLGDAARARIHLAAGYYSTAISLYSDEGQTAKAQSLESKMKDYALDRVVTRL